MALTQIKAKSRYSLQAMLDAIAEPGRRAILRMLKETGCCSIGKDEGMCACDIEQRLDLSQPTISHHMAVLKKAGLVTASREGQWIWYRRNEEALRELARGLETEL
jgi:ArsR family transcriptional regulator